MVEKVTHTKSGDTYNLIAYATDCTNARVGNCVAIYSRLDSGHLFVRDIAECREKFSDVAGPQLHPDVIADQMAADNVRRLMDGTIIGEPLVGTLAHRVWRHLDPFWFPREAR